MSSVDIDNMDTTVTVATPTAVKSTNSTATTSIAGVLPRTHTLIHFKKNSRHAVSQALAELKWTEVRIRIPKRKGRTTERTFATSSSVVAAIAATAGSSPMDDEDEEEDGEPADGCEDEIDLATQVIAAAAVSDVKTRPKKVKQPKSLLLNLKSYTAFFPVTEQLAPASELKWDIAWMDVLSENEYKTLTRAQRINQLPLMYRLTKKKYLALHLNQMREEEPEEYSFYPRSWVLPQELSQLKAYYASIEKSPSSTPSPSPESTSSTSSTATAASSSPTSTLAATPILIVKPDFACEGKGIYLVDRLSSIDLSIPLVVQQYIDRPLLLDGIKFDLRLYVLITSVQPLSIFLFDDGLTRFCTDSYVQPTFGSLGSSYQHLTNYAINKKNVNKFVYNTDATQSNIGNKWSVKSLLQKLKSEGRDVDLLWQRIGDVITKSIISSYGTLSHAYKTTFSGTSADVDGGHCFQFLGFDILIDEAFNPILIEINRNCSLKCDTPLDSRIKVRAITQTLQLIDPRAAYRTRSKEVLAAERESLRSLSGAAYKMAQQARQQARYDARFQYEDKCIRKFQKEAEGGWQRIYPLVPSYQLHSNNPSTTTATTESTPTSSTPTVASSPTSLPTPTQLARQSVYDRLLQLSLKQHQATNSSTTTTTTSGGTKPIKKVVPTKRTTVNRVKSNASDVKAND